MPIDFSFLDAEYTEHTAQKIGVPVENPVVVDSHTEHTEHTKKNNVENEIQKLPDSIPSKDDQSEFRNKADDLIASHRGLKATYAKNYTETEPWITWGDDIKNAGGVLDTVPEEKISCYSCQHKKPYYPQNVLGGNFPVSSGLIICSISGETMPSLPRRNCKDSIFSGG